MKDGHLALGNVSCLCEVPRGLGFALDSKALMLQWWFVNGRWRGREER